MLIDIQCRECEYGDSVFSITVKFEVRLACEKYKRGIPKYVEDGEFNCPKFKEKEK